MSTAIVFPGMGPSRFSEVGRFMMISPFARRRLADADAALGYSVLDALRSAGDGYTAASQIAFVVNSLAMADWAEEVLGERPQLCVGPSFGERAATAYSGAMPFDELIRLTAELAACELDYYRTEQQDVVSQFIVRTPLEKLREVLDGMAGRGEWHEVSAYFDQDVHLVTMAERHLDGFKQHVRDLGGYSLTTMRPPAHAQVLEPLRKRMQDEVYPRFSFSAPVLPVISDQDGSLVTTGADVRTMLVDSVVNQVHWGHITRALAEQGVTRLCVAGPDLLIHRLGTLKKNFELISVGPKDAMRPRRPARRHVVSR
ncbi:ACP S-malonyltransferase [Allokutzneria albata]|uniref:[acyl-carrier-protein] S-malonyltransferase n=1 Tax=Allokutzneria albata TaxID=211114 RepID=A0A1G9RNV5_ALLAB|nr:ACP S-malonyltransferase [Allokutzneria albata]SDM24864.1 [acyl-carrier-protein] S-malonyltransferase [Allokutzneria albata]